MASELMHSTETAQGPALEDQYGAVIAKVAFSKIEVVYRTTW